jgi:endonuclease/exonuclease/phosphatase family metal-dependent hydrolase
MFAPLLIFGFAGDHLIRLFGATVDVSWSSEFLVEQTVVSLALFLIAVLSAVAERLSPSDDARGAISGWSALALGGMLFLEFTFFGLSNTLGHRVGVDYFTIAPFLMVASTLPLVPAVRSFARDFLNIFDAQYRGWIWFLLICLLVVIGVRIGGLPGASALIVAQFMIGLSWWWLGQPATGRFNLTGISVLLGSVVFLLLAGAEFFTYEYAFVRNVDETLGSLLRAFRGGGIPLILFALLLMALPIILTRRRPPWKGAPLTVTMAALALVIAASALAYLYAQPVPLVVQSDSNKIRIGSLNLHGGYSLYYGSNLNAIAASIRESGADIVLLQEIEAGRLVSASVDQAAWLGQALTMQVYYFPTNEALQGLAVLSRLPAEQTAGALLTSRSKQTGVQFVRVRTPAGGMLDIYNTQLSLIFRSETLAVEAQQQDQDTQMLQIFEYIEQNGSTSRKLLLGGTFNHTPADKIYTVLGQRNYIDPFAGLSAERSKTLRLVSQPPVRVDYVWLYCPQQGAPNCLQPVGVSIVPQLFSSHNLALVELQLAPASP